MPPDLPSDTGAAIDGPTAVATDQITLALLPPSYVTFDLTLASSTVADVEAVLTKFKAAIAAADALRGRKSAWLGFALFLLLPSFDFDF